MIDRQQIAAHLKLFSDLGVQGVSRELAWRERASAVVVDSTPEVPVDTSSIAHELMPTSDASGSSPERTPLENTSLDNPSALAAVRADIGDCTRCQLHTLGRRQIVFGVGNPSADLMFVGEAPGADEDMQGVPFVGQAGQLLTRIIEAIGLKRDDVYIANVIKCRPPGNRNPEPIEVATCEPFLFRQIDIINPKVIVALGTFAAQALLKSTVPISKLRGNVYDFRGTVKLIPTFHPAYLLRNRNNTDLKRDVWEDMKKARALLSASTD